MSCPMQYARASHDRGECALEISDFAAPPHATISDGSHTPHGNLKEKNINFAALFLKESVKKSQHDLFVYVVRKRKQVKVIRVSFVHTIASHSPLYWGRIAPCPPLP